jgi:hypothetical protein
VTIPVHVTLLTAILHAKSIEGGDEAVYDALRVVIGMHKPHKVRNTDSLHCKQHNPAEAFHSRQRHDYDRREIDDCPDCVVTYPEACSSRTCLDCGMYPCETLRNIAAVFAAIKIPGDS